MYPFSIATDERVPLMGAIRIFFKEGPVVEFPRGMPTMFFQGGQKWQNYIFTTQN